MMKSIFNAVAHTKWKLYDIWRHWCAPSTPKPVKYPLSNMSPKDTRRFHVKQHNTWLFALRSTLTQRSRLVGTFNHFFGGPARRNAMEHGIGDVNVDQDVSYLYQSLVQDSRQDKYKQNPQSEPPRSTPDLQLGRIWRWPRSICPYSHT